VKVQRCAHALLVLAAAIASACGGDDTPDTAPCPIGDMSAPAELEIVHLDAQNMVVKTQAMTEIPLQQPPQGGWIVLLGARARNIDGCRITLKTTLVDPCNGEILSLDARPTKLVLGSDGWGMSSLTTFGNLAVCPQPTASLDVHDVPYVMQVIVEDSDGKKAQAQITVVPVCPAGNAMCTCQCARDYVVGSACGTAATDAGVPHTSCPGAARAEPTPP
jgi:hypothetical protein